MPPSRPATAGHPAASRSLAGRIGRAIFLWCALATICATAAGSVLVSAKIERQAVVALKNHILQRGRTESLIFETAEANLALFRQRFLEAYADENAYRTADFDTYFFHDEDGAIRLRERHFSGVRDENGAKRSGLSGFIGRRRGELTPEFKRRLVIGYHLLAQLGPGWASQFANLHASYPENALLMYWPQEPWGLQASPDLDMTAGAVIKATLTKHNPERRPVWSGLYHDLTAGRWAVTYQLPTDFEGRHLINPSHDIFLDGLIDRLTRGSPEGARNLILSPNGDLVAQPERMQEILKSKGVLNVHRIGDAQLLSIYRTLAAQGSLEGGRIIKSEALDAYIAAVPIRGPGWWYVTVFPHPIIAQEARNTAGVVLVTTLLLSAFIMTIVLLVLRLRVSGPMRAMRRASEAVANGQYGRVAGDELALPGGDDEVGVLARSFRDMAEKVDTHSRRLEATVAERTSELEQAKRRLEDLLNEREALHQRYQQAVGFIVMFEGPDHRVTFANTAFETFVGSTNLTGQTLAALLPALGEGPLADMLDQVFRSGRPLSRTVRVHAASNGNKAMFLDATCQPIRNTAGEVAGVFFEGRDITEQRHAQEKIATLQAQLIHVSRASAMGTMGTTLAHELNQPLAAIANYSAALRKSLSRMDVDARLKEIADAISRSSIRAGEIIRSLRRLTSKEEPRARVANLRTLVDEAISLALLGAPEDAKIDAEIGEDVEISADPIQIQQVLLNLVRNGFEANPSATPRIFISASVDQGSVTVCVEDDGEGISAEAFPHLFDSFFSTKALGTGIGLSISRTIIEAHGGTLWAENRENGGARFCFKLPGGEAPSDKA